jgi:uncharacterized RDD family membrane protein YckC
MSVPRLSVETRGAKASSRVGRPAGVLSRALATLIDMAVYCGLCALLALPVVRAAAVPAIPRDLAQLTAAITDPSWISHASGVLGIWVALWWSYFVVGWGLLGATPGKWLLRIRIVDHHRRFPIGLSRAILRLVAYMVSSLTLGVGHLLLLFRSDRCALHDLLAGTQVVRLARRSSARDPA